MQAVQLTAPRTATVGEQPDLAPTGDQVLVRVLACGVCASDLNAWLGVPGIQFPLAPGLPGHEVWGEVAAVGPAVPAGHFRSGQRVTGLFQGGYAQYALASAAEIVALPEALGDRIVLGEPLACAANIVRRCAVQPGDRVAIVGFGYIAAVVAQLLFAGRATEWVAVSRRPESRDLARQLGASAAYSFDDVPSTMWDSFPVVIEATGVQRALDYAAWLTAYSGRLVIAGYHADGPRTVNMQSWNWKGIDVINAHERQPAVYVRGLRAGLQTLGDHQLPLDRLISHRWPLGRTAEALQTAEARPPDYTKGVVLPWE